MTDSCHIRRLVGKGKGRALRGKEEEVVDVDVEGKLFSECAPVLCASLASRTCPSDNLQPLCAAQIIFPDDKRLPQHDPVRI